jgi:hypothetical protein
MTINASDFRSYVIQPALAALAPAGIPVTKTAGDLLMATAAMETDLGTWLTQVGGPALGVFQIEPESLDNLVSRLSAKQVTALFSVMPAQPTGAEMSGWVAENIEGNLLLAAAICRLFYWQAPFAMPASSTVSRLWTVYKTWYNTAEGGATMADFVTALKLTDLAGLSA